MLDDDLAEALDRRAAEQGQSKAALIRNGSADEIEDEDGPGGLLTPVVPLRQPTLADFYAQPSDEEEFMSQAGSA